eukprot:scaffold243740_cov19-Tisochrysis_lutea.AAC.1
MQYAKVTHQIAYRRIPHNRYNLLPREEAAPHSYNNNNTDMSAEQFLSLLDQRFTQFEQKQQDTSAVLNNKLDAISTQQQRLLTEVEVLKQSDAHGKTRLTQLENGMQSLTHDVHTMRANVHEYSSSHNLQSRDFASIWAEDTKHDTTKFDDIAGYVFVKPTDGSIVNPTSLAQTLGTDKPITPHPTTPNAFRVTVGNKGRDGVMAVTSFLNSVKSRVPQNLMVKREKITLSLMRTRSLKSVYDTITHVITTQPKLNGLK